MEGYNAIVPGAAERIIAIFEAEVLHRHSLEQQHAAAEHRERSHAHFLVLLGQILGFIVTVAFIISGAFLIFHDKQISGTILSTTGMIGIVTAFLNSSKKK